MNKQVQNKSFFIYISLNFTFAKIRFYSKMFIIFDKCTYMHHKIYQSIFSKQLRISYKTVYMNICLHLHIFARTRASKKRILPFIYYPREMIHKPKVYRA